MNVSANFLTRWCRAKYSHNGYFKRRTLVLGCQLLDDGGIQMRRKALVVVNTVEANAKILHGKCAGKEKKRSAMSDMIRAIRVQL